MVNVWFRQILILTPWGLLGFNEAPVDIFDKSIEPNFDFHLEVVLSRPSMGKYGYLLRQYNFLVIVYNVTIKLQLNFARSLFLIKY